ncbi:MAG: hypothetical protein V7635_9 [Arthrobacter sp.]|jgi:hypothetical protein
MLQKMAARLVPLQGSDGIWKLGAPEPTTWQPTTTDPTAALQAAGRIGLFSYYNRGANPASRVMSADDLWAGTAGKSPQANRRHLRDTRLEMARRLSDPYSPTNIRWCLLALLTLLPAIARG